MHNPDLSIVLVNYNGGEDILRCLRSLRRVSTELMLEIVVVDNGSTDMSLERVATEFPECHIDRAGENLGFAAGCNRGLQRAQGRHAMLLNPDTEVCAGALKSLVDALDFHPRWGIVGARMVEPDGAPYAAARRFPRPFDLFCECTKLSAIFPRSRVFARYFYGEQKLTQLEQVDQVEGSALVISGRVRKAVGDLDPRFFVFFEEVDWCRRVQEAGYEIHLVQRAQIVHYRATTMSRFYLQSRLYNAESACRYFEKWEGARGVRSLKRWMASALWIREWGVRTLALLRPSERLRIKADAARQERAFYRKFQVQER